MLFVQRSSSDAFRPALIIANDDALQALFVITNDPYFRLLTATSRFIAFPRPGSPVAACAKNITRLCASLVSIVEWRILGKLFFVFFCNFSMFPVGIVGVSTHLHKMYVHAITRIIKPLMRWNLANLVRKPIHATTRFHHEKPPLGQRGCCLPAVGFRLIAVGYWLRTSG